MDSCLRHWIIWAVTALLGCPLSAVAQQSFSRPIVLYRPPTAAVPVRRHATVFTTSALAQIGNDPQSADVTTGPNGASQRSILGSSQIPAGSMIRWATTDSGASRSTTDAQQVSQTSQTGPSGQPNGNNSDSQQNAVEKEWAAQQSLPTNQQMQNPSGAYNMSHSGITASQQYAPNLYFGSQFQTWSNLRTMADLPALSGEMSRFQPGPFEGYVAPNTYLGSGFFNWNNLSSGNVSPAASGGWSYSIWP